MRKKLSNTYNLLVLFPEIAKDWDYEKNDIKPSEITPGSNRNAWWRCDSGHEFQASIANRTRGGTGCPYCSGRKISNNSLEHLFPELASEWDYVKNGTLTPDKVLPGSNKKVWWICKKNQGHRWQTGVHMRAGSRKTGCPYCSGQRVTRDKSLGVVYPGLSNQLHSTNGALNIFTINPQSAKKVFWQCEKNSNHIWEARINTRAIRGYGCPFCAGKKVLPEESFAAEYPNLLSEWDYSKNKFKPTEIRTGTGKNVHWVCSDNPAHTWTATPHNRAINNSGCPICSGNAAWSEYNLVTEFPKIAADWDYGKNEARPEEFLPKSRQKVWWICKFKPEHQFQKIISNRTIHGHGCPHCSIQSSRAEIRIYAELLAIFPNAKHRHKEFGYEFDVFIPELKTAIEYDGFYYHKDQLEKDILKNNFCEDKDIRLVRFREMPLEQIKSTDILVSRGGITPSDIAALIKILIEKTEVNPLFLDKEYNEFQNDKTYQKIVDALPAPVRHNSLAEQNKDLASEWHYELNAPLTPYSFNPNAHYRAWWKCNIDPHHKPWQAAIYSRNTGVGCPTCAGRVPSATKNLKVIFPKVAQEWDYEKNHNNPEDYTPGSGQKVWWICPNNSNHSYEAKIFERTRKSYPKKCPLCPRRSGGHNHG